MVFRLLMLMLMMVLMTLMMVMMMLMMVLMMVLMNCPLCYQPHLSHECDTDDGGHIDDGCGVDDIDTLNHKLGMDQRTRRLLE